MQRGIDGNSVYLIRVSCLEEEGEVKNDCDGVFSARRSLPPEEELARSESSRIL
jgi:hypothetical protein